MYHKLFYVFAFVILNCFAFIAQIENKNSDRQIKSNISPFEFCQKDTNPIGGGENYDEIFSSYDATIRIENFTNSIEFKAKIENAQYGDIIFIDGNLTIDLTKLFEITGEPSIKIPAGVTIASDRGISKGALIFTEDFDFYNNKTSVGRPIFVANGNNVRLTGIRFKGPYQDQGTNSPISAIRYKTCIEIADNNNGIEIDNCVFYGWPYKAIRIGRGVAYPSFNGNKIHHCYFYNNRQMGLGYGVGIDCGYARIYSNIFRANRHDIAGSGKKGSGYEAFCNTVLEGSTSHNFDMHEDKKTSNAGRAIYIHHNDFQDTGSQRYQRNNDENIWIRSRPYVQCRIEKNRFAHPDPETAIRQENRNGGYGNMLVWNNYYNSLSDSISKRKIIIDSSFANSQPTQNSFMKTSSAKSNTYEYEFSFGDYYGNGSIDIIKKENGKLYRLSFDASNFNRLDNWEVLKPNVEKSMVNQIDPYECFTKIMMLNCKINYVSKYGPTM